MRRALLMVLIATIVIGVGSVLLAGHGKGPGDGTGICPCICGAAVDADGDGICDICDGCVPIGDGPFGPKGPGNGSGSGCLSQCQGVCDGPCDGTGIGPCDCGALVDEDGDGYCDVCGGCIPVGDGPFGPKKGPKNK